MPAAAVIPAPIAYIKVAAVKKLVVGFVARSSGGASKVIVPRGRLSGFLAAPFFGSVSLALGCRLLRADRLL